MRLLFDQPPHYEKFTLECTLVRKFRAADEKLTDPGRGLPCRFSCRLQYDGYVAPPEDLAAFGTNDRFQDRLFAESSEDHGNSVLPARRQCRSRVGAEKGIRDGGQKSGAVSGLRIASRRAAVHQAA